MQGFVNQFINGLLNGQTHHQGQADRDGLVWDNPGGFPDPAAVAVRPLDEHGTNLRSGKVGCFVIRWDNRGYG